jgi:hypothetical protein
LATPVKPVAAAIMQQPFQKASRNYLGSETKITSVTRTEENKELHKP